MQGYTINGNAPFRPIVTAASMDATAVTIIMPLRNYHEGFLRRAVGSVFAQSSPLWQLLIVVEPGEYAVRATHAGRDYKQDFSVKVGDNTLVEVIKP